jgi:hypothetical protein
MGATQRYRLVETLLETGVAPTYTWRDVNVIPARILPPKALVLGLTPLIDPRFIAALSDLRAGFRRRRRGGRPVLVQPGRGGERPRSGSGRSSARLAHGSSQLASGSRWQEEGPRPTEEVRTFRRYARTARV